MLLKPENAKQAFTHPQLPSDNAIIKHRLATTKHKCIVITLNISLRFNTNILHVAKSKEFLHA